MRFDAGRSTPGLAEQGGEAVMAFDEGVMSQAVKQEGVAHLARVLPMDAAICLFNASQTSVTDSDPLARLRAIERAIEKVRSEYRWLFQ